MELGVFECKILINTIFHRYPYFAKLSIYRLIDMSYRYIKHPEMEWMLDGWMGWDWDPDE